MKLINCPIDSHFFDCVLNIGGAKHLYVIPWNEDIELEYDENCNEISKLKVKNNPIFEIQFLDNTLRVQTTLTEGSNSNAKYTNVTIDFATLKGCTLLKYSNNFKVNRYVAIVEDNQNDIWLYGFISGLKFTQFNHLIGASRQEGNYFNLQLSGKDEGLKLKDKTVLEDALKDKTPIWEMISTECQTYIHQGQTINTGVLIYTYQDVNENSETFGETKTEEVEDLNVCPLADLEPKWEIISQECVVDSQGKNVGTLQTTKQDINPLSMTYGRTQVSFEKKESVCPIPKEEEKKYLVADNTMKETGVYGTHKDALQLALYRLGIAKNEHYTTFEEAEAATVFPFKAIGGGASVWSYGVDNFDELEYFTNISELEPECFKDLNTPSFVLPVDVTVIPNLCFSNSKIQTFTFNEKLTKISDRAFINCNSITSLVIPDSVQNIEYGAFWNMKNLTTAKLPLNCTIGQYLFNGCISLKNVTLPNNIKSIPENTFFNCTSLANIVLPNSVTEIRPNAFSNNTSLNTVNLSNVETIYSLAFKDCKNLGSIDLSSCKNLGLRAFTNAYIESVKLNAFDDVVKNTKFGGKVFEGSSIITVYVKRGDLEKWKEIQDSFFLTNNISNWSEY